MHVPEWYNKAVVVCYVMWCNMFSTNILVQAILLWIYIDHRTSLQVVYGITMHAPYAKPWIQPSLTINVSLYSWSMSLNYTECEFIFQCTSCVRVFVFPCQTASYPQSPAMHMPAHASGNTGLPLPCLWASSLYMWQVCLSSCPYLHEMQHTAYVRTSCLAMHLLRCTQQQQRCVRRGNCQMCACVPRACVSYCRPLIVEAPGA